MVDSINRSENSFEAKLLHKSNTFVASIVLYAAGASMSLRPTQHPKYIESTISYIE